MGELLYCAEFELPVGALKGKRCLPDPVEPDSPAVVMELVSNLRNLGYPMEIPSRAKSLGHCATIRKFLFDSLRSTDGGRRGRQQIYCQGLGTTLGPHRLEIEAIKQQTSEGG
jgi:hypothetical protein